MALALALPLLAQAQEPKFNLGFRMGAGRIEGDVKHDVIRPFGSGFFQYSPDPHFAIGLEAGYGEFLIDDDAVEDSIARVAPFELDLTLRFSPYSTFSPFVSLGGGGTAWHNRRKQDKQTLHYDDSRDYTTVSLKTSGGMDISVSRLFNLSFGASFRYIFTDKLDLDPNGDEDDALITFFGGLTWKFGGGPPDRDHDGVWDRYDLDSRAKEDRDGYMDHDGVPDTQISSNLLAFSGSTSTTGVDDIPPIVIHKPITRATSSKDLKVQAEVFENRSLLKTAVLYRPYNVRRWMVEPMVSADGEKFVATLPGMMVQKVGLEYCIVAVDEAISGLGYSGLLKRPNFVQVHGNQTWWRVATILAAAGGWGTAAYLVDRPQKADP